MIRLRFRERLADFSFRAGRRVTIEEVAQRTGISTATLSKLSSPRPYNATVDTLDKLCEFFGCPLADLAEYVPGQSGLKPKGPTGTNTA